MKPLAIALLAGSLVLNLALGIFALTGRARVADELAAATAAKSARAATRSDALSVDPQTWAKLQTDDLPSLVARLREAGFPKEVIRAMLSGLINEQFAARRRALDPAGAGRAYWKDQPPDPKLELARFQLYSEQEKILRALLGPDARSTDPLALARDRSRFGDLTPEKMDAAQLIVSEFERKRGEFYYKNGSMTSADLAPLEREQRAALAAVLSPTELEEYDLRNSNTGRSLRSELSAFNATEDEFRAIFKLRQPFDERFASFGGGFLSQEQMQQRTEAQKQMLAQLRSFLTPERAVEYERATDYNFRQTSQLVARLELPPQTTVSLWNTQKEFEKRRGELYGAGVALTAEERTRQLTVLQQEAIAKVTPLLGTASRVETYRQYGGTWISNLVPRPRPGG